MKADVTNTQTPAQAAPQTGTQPTKSISDALSVLDRAAEKSADEIRNMIERDYQSLFGLFQEWSPRIRSTVQNLTSTSREFAGNARTTVVDGTRRAAETTRQAASTVDRQVHERPWMYIGGAALAGGIVAYFLARRPRQ